jgi:hypothetical protein
LRTPDFFPEGAPTLRQTPITLFPDLDGDGRADILFADAGLDHPPWTGSRIGVAINQGGKYRNITSLVPAQFDTTRSYSIAAGDLFGDGHFQIILPDQSACQNTALLHWNGTGFDVRTHWIDSALWGPPTNLCQQSWLGIADLDNDGKQDLVITGQSTQPNLRLVFGAPGGFVAANVLQLPDGPFGHTPFENWLDAGRPFSSGADVTQVVIADFDRDGLQDIFALEEHATYYQAGVLTDTSWPNYADIHANGGTLYGDIALQIFMNKGARKFIDYTAASSTSNLGRKLYHALMPIDLNNDGFVDMVANYTTKPYGVDKGSAVGATIFLNDGTGAFQIVDGADLLPVTSQPLLANGQRQLGGFYPTRVDVDHTEGLLIELVNGYLDGTAVNPATGGTLNVTKITSFKSLGTGPHFAHSASLGVPGFNEFYYLRTYPDAAAAVTAGEYPTGLAHYLAVGKSKGHYIFAPNAKINGADQLGALALTNGSRTDFVLKPVSGGCSITDLKGRYGTLTLVGIKYIEFADTLIRLAPSCSPIEGANIDQHGLTGSWYQAATSGQGVELEVFKDLVAPGNGFLQGSWFTFDSTASGGPDRGRWYTFGGAVRALDATVIMPLYQNVGGNFDAPPVTRPMQVGSVALTFTDCTSGQFDYSFSDGSNRSGSIPLTRLTPNVTCSVDGTDSASSDFALSGNWYDSAKAGQGFVVEVNPVAKVLFLAWYTYANNGQAEGTAGQRWYTGQGAFAAGARSIPLLLYETTGGLFDAAMPVPVTNQIGAATLSFANCSSAQLAFNFASGSNAGQFGAIDLTRVGSIPASCAR